MNGLRFKLASAMMLAHFVVSVCSAYAGDWPTFRGDIQRRGVSDEAIDPGALGEAWALSSNAPPQTAWGGPAKWDAYAGIRGLRSMRNYDVAFGLAVVGQRAYVASSSDDSVACVELSTGKIRWRFWADAPVRISPTVADGRVYFGSDDGYAYCVSADDGKLIWRFRPPVSELLILHNGRMISRWPCRTGVLVHNQKAYCGFSMLPWDDSFICCVDSKSGKAEGPGCFVRKLSGASIEGALAASDQFLIAPQGRVSPRVFNLIDGTDVRSLGGGGGSFVTVAADQTILHGPGNKTGWITVSNPKMKKPLKSHKGCNAIVIGKALEYRLSDHHVTAVDRKSNKVVWKSQIAIAHDLVLNRKTVFVGGRDEVVALSAETGARVWSGAVDGDAYLLAVASGSLLVSTDTGTVHCFRPSATGAVKKPPITKVSPPPKKVPPPAKGDLPAAPPKLRVVRQPGVVGHWLVHSGMGERAKRRGLADAERRIPDLAGKLDGKILGDVNLRQAAGIEALVLDGVSNSVMLAEDHNTAGLPKRQITAEAWVRVDKQQPWGGIVGAIQDNGSFERGWILGYTGSKFCFAVNGTGGEDKLTYLTATSSFKSETWYHVVGTYDGTTQQIFVNGKLENSSTAQSGDIHYPPKAFYEIGAYHDKDENFRLTGMVHEIRVYERALKLEEVQASHKLKQSHLPKPIRLAAGPYARFVDRHTAEIVWRTQEPVPSQLIVSNAGESHPVTDKRLKTQHRLRVEGLKHNRVYTYRTMTGDASTTHEFELDTTFNFTRVRAAEKPSPYTDEDASKNVVRDAKSILTESGVTSGICLVLGAEDGQLMYELVRQSDLIVIGVETDKAKVAKARAALTRAGVYGHRAAIHHVQSLDQLPLVGDFANLVVSDSLRRGSKIPGNAQELLRVLRPNGGLAMIGQTVDAPHRISVDALRAWCKSLKCEISDDARGVWTRVTRGPLEGAGEWSHLYGRADNSAFGGESLAEARGSADLHVQWLGRPGPRAQPDRNGRKPSPLSTGGRLFVQGLHRLIGLDAYNGTVLWALEIPPMQRFNMPRDSSNWCADDQHVFVAIKDACWNINAQSGQVESMTAVQPGGREKWNYDWSYIARHRDKLIGSAVKSDSAFVEFWGKADAGWYDARQGPATFKVCSDNLFALDKSSGKRAWTYAKGVILNSTITAANGRVFFVECRHPKVIAAESRRIGSPELWSDLHMVALDVDSGRVVWQRPLATAKGIVTYAMAQGEGTLAIVASGSKKYDVYAFSDSDGKPIWNRSIAWPGGKGDHGKAMARPGIAGTRLFVRPEVLDLRTGKTVAKMPGGGCGTYALTAHTAIFRSGNVTLWDPASNRSSSWNRLRPGCWLSTIPAGGMLLSPEAGGGCSCGKWLETSIGFMPNRP